MLILDEINPGVRLTIKLNSGKLGYENLSSAQYGGLPAKIVIEVEASICKLSEGMTFQGKTLNMIELPVY